MSIFRMPVFAAISLLVLGGCEAEVTYTAEVSGKTFSNADVPAYAFAIHGGAGTITRDKLTPEVEAEIRADLMTALKAGEAVLADGGAALDAVEAAIIILEDSEHFNAGKGAVFTADGVNELDVSLMDGATLNVGAASGIRAVKNPIKLARAVMDKSLHVMLSGAGADAFAVQEGIETVDPSYFRTDYRWNQLQSALARQSSAVLDTDVEYKYGTVGAVALDQNGNLAAGTSTGGMTNKRFGRIGDAPIIGAGTYADNASCAVSATGHGEYFIRATVARSICAQMQFADKSLEEAANAVVMQQLVEMGGSGGIIAVGKDGSVSLTFNSAGMYRGSVVAGGEPSVAIYGDE